MNNKRVVITGMGVVSPNGTGLDNFCNAIATGRSGVRFMERLEELNFGCRIAAVPEIKENGHKAHINDELLNDNIGYGAIAAIEAWQDAGLAIPDADAVADWDSGTIYGCGICGMETIATRVVPAINGGKVRRLGSTIVERVMGSGVSATVAGILGLGNQVTSNSSACSTGTEAIIDAAFRIRSGLAKRMVAGGAEGPSPYIWGGFDSMRIVLSRKFNDRPEQGSRPMSASACGFVPGAGAGCLVLEDMETAISRGAKIYGEIAGAMVNCGGQRQGGSMTAPNPEGVVRCIRGAVADAGIHPDEIDAINGHLTATYADPHEVKSWATALERGPGNFPYINSTKSMIGHCLGAAGAIETIAAVLELQGGFLHPSINCEDIHPDIQPFEKRVVRERLDFPEIRTIAKASFGFGDVNSCIIIKKQEKYA
ncbi:MAG: beta-ketoacyl-[acyl-carrier-protein] synthase family protein [Desulfosalsimonadaceae bacterium]